MSDTKRLIRSGFFDAVNGDRVYSADDMTLPYKDIVSDGVFQSGTNFLVSAGTGLSVTVSEGHAMLANRWVESSSVQTFTVPSNNSGSTRIDSVVLQVDTQQSGRNANIIYRTGSTSAPAISTSGAVLELRLANVTVTSGATSVSGKVSDTRGSADCPWVTGLITQVDTSTLWQQFSEAYSEQYDEFAAQNTAFQNQQRQAWNDFFSTLTQNLTAVSSVIPITSTYTTSGTTTTVPIGIAGYDSSTDVLMVFINGLYAAGKYTISGTNITLNTALPAGNTILFLCLKSIVAGDVASVASDIQALETAVAALSADTGWTAATTESGVYYIDAIEYRKIGNHVYLRGCVDSPSSGDLLGTIPVSAAPAKDVWFAAADQGTSNAVCCRVTSSGFIYAEDDSSSYMHLDFNWLAHD